MKNKPIFWVILVTLAILAMGVRAEAQTEPPRLTLEPDVYAYTVPREFVPPHVGAEGLVQVERALGRLNFRFYVVLVARLPDGLTRRTLADALINDWRAHQSSLFTPEASLLLVSYQPRTWEFVPGRRWMGELGLRGDGPLQPFRDAYLARAQNELDPLGVAQGTIDLVQAFDTHVFDRVDPARQEARRVAIMQAAQERRKVRAWTDTRARLIRAIAQADQVRRRLPGLGYPASLEQAFGGAYEDAVFVAQTRTPSEEVTFERLEQATDRLEGENRALKEFIDSQDARNVSQFLLVCIALMVFVAIAVYLRKARRIRAERADRIREEIDDALASLERCLTRFDLFDTRFRDLLAQNAWLATGSGQTGDLRDRSRADLERFRAVIDIGRDRVTAIRARILKVGNDSDALSGILVDAGAAFQTVVTETAAMGSAFRLPPPSEEAPAPSSLTPAQWAEERESDLAVLAKDEQDLERLIRFQATAKVETDLPVGWFLQVQRRAIEIGLPASWYATHPYAQGVEAVQADLADLLNTDPEAYRLRVADLAAVHEQIIANFAQVEALVAPIFGDLVEAATPEGMVVEGETPETILIRAGTAENHLRALLDRPSTTIDQLRQQAEIVSGLREKAVALAAELRLIVAAAPDANARLESAFANADEAKRQVEVLIVRAVKDFAEFSRASFDQAITSFEGLAKRSHAVRVAYREGRYAEVVQEGRELPDLLITATTSFTTIYLSIQRLAADRDQLTHALTYARKLAGEAQARIDAAEAHFQAAKARQANPRGAEDTLAAAKACLAAGTRKIASAVQAQAERRYSSALKTVQNAELDFATSKSKADRTIDDIDAFERQVKALEAQPAAKRYAPVPGRAPSSIPHGASSGGGASRARPAPSSGRPSGGGGSGGHSHPSAHHEDDHAPLRGFHAAGFADHHAERVEHRFEDTSGPAQDPAPSGASDNPASGGDSSPSSGGTGGEW